MDTRVYCFPIVKSVHILPLLGNSKQLRTELPILIFPQCLGMSETQKMLCRSWSGLSIWQRLIFRRTKNQPTALGLYWIFPGSWMCVKVSIYRAGIMPLSPRRWWKGNRPLLVYCREQRSWPWGVPCKAADVGHPWMPATIKSFPYILVFPVSSIYILIGKALVSVAPSLLSWSFSGQDQRARVILVGDHLARKELSDLLFFFIGLVMKDEEKKAVYCSATWKDIPPLWAPDELEWGHWGRQ